MLESSLWMPYAVPYPEKERWVVEWCPDSNYLGFGFYVICWMNNANLSVLSEWWITSSVVLCKWAMLCWLTVGVSVHLSYECVVIFMHPHYLYYCSIQEDLLHLAPLLPHPRILPVMMKKRECQEDPSPSLRGQRRKRSSNQEARILEPIVKIMVQFPFQDSLGASRVNSSNTWLCIIKLFSANSKFWSAILWDQRILYSFVILYVIILCVLFPKDYFVLG